MEAQHKHFRESTLLKSIKSFLLFLPLTFLLACSSATPTPPGAVVDDLGRSVSIVNEPQRIISLAPSNTEILFSLGLGDKVVGVTDYCNYPPEALNKTKIGGFSTPDIEKIVALQPDLILAADIDKTEVIPALEGHGLTVFALDPKDLDGILKDISMVGKITGKEKEANELVTQMGNRIRAITDKTKNLEERPRVFYITFHNPLWTVGVGSFIHELVDKSGGVNIFQDIAGNKAVNIELVIARNPEVIIASTGHGAAGGQPFEWAKTESRLQATEARKNNRIYEIDADLVSRSGPRIVDGLEWLAYFIHPEIFGEPGVVR